jgi:hypothetical protein
MLLLLVGCTLPGTLPFHLGASSFALFHRSCWYSVGVLSFHSTPLGHDVTALGYCHLGYWVKIHYAWSLGQMPLRFVALFQVERYTTVLPKKIGCRSKPTRWCCCLRLKRHTFWSGPCIWTLAK